MPKLNIKLLRRIKSHLSAEPKRYDQGTWGKHVEGENAPACHTEGCIAGWAVFLSVPKRNWLRWIRRSETVSIDVMDSGIPLRAKKLLGLTRDEAAVLFSPSNQEYSFGLDGVVSARRKIDALIDNREQFVKGEDVY